MPDFSRLFTTSAKAPRTSVATTMESRTSLPEAPESSAHAMIGQTLLAGCAPPRGPAYVFSRSRCRVMLVLSMAASGAEARPLLPTRVQGASGLVRMDLRTMLRSGSPSAPTVQPILSSKPFLASCTISPERSEYDNPQAKSAMKSEASFVTLRAADLPAPADVAASVAARAPLPSKPSPAVVVAAAMKERRSMELRVMGRLFACLSRTRR